MVNQKQFMLVKKDRSITFITKTVCSLETSSLIEIMPVFRLLVILSPLVSITIAILQI